MWLLSVSFNSNFTKPMISVPVLDLHNIKLKMSIVLKNGMVLWYFYLVCWQSMVSLLHTDFPQGYQSSMTSDVTFQIFPLRWNLMCIAIIFPMIIFQTKARFIYCNRIIPSAKTTWHSFNSTPHAQYSHQFDSLYAVRPVIMQ